MNVMMTAGEIVSEFVRDHELRFVLGKGFDERVAENDSMRSSDPGNESIRLTCLTAHIHS